MNQPTCKACGAVALEVDGQFEKLDSYYLEDDGPPPESAGYWHTSCFVNSGYGPAWHDVRLRNHIGVRGYTIVVSEGDWTVIKHPREKETLALSRRGEFVSLTYPPGKPRSVAGGSIYRRVDKEFHFKDDDEELIQKIQESLLATKTFPILAVFEAFEIANRILHPEALRDSHIHFTRELRRYWSRTSVSARWEYGVFVPAELVKYVVRTS
jgi:hypothetical protein